MGVKVEYRPSPRSVADKLQPAMKYSDWYIDGKQATAHQFLQLIENGTLHIFTPEPTKSVIDQFPSLFPNYARLFRQLSAEYDRTREWQLFRQYRILRKMRKLNERYMKWFDEHLAQAEQK